MNTTRTQATSKKTATPARRIRALAIAAAIAGVAAPAITATPARASGDGYRLNSIAHYASVAGVSGLVAPNFGHGAVIAERTGQIHHLPQAGYGGDFVRRWMSSPPVAVAAYYSPDDGVSHAMVALRDRTLHEVYFSPTYGPFDYKVATFSKSIVGIGAYYTPDRNRHTIVALRDGTIHDVYFLPGQAVHDVVIAQLRGVVALSGFYTSDDGFGHAIVALRDRTVHELYFRNGSVGNALLHTYPTRITAVGGFSYQTWVWPNGNPVQVEERDVVVKLADGTIHEIWFNPRFGIGEGKLNIDPSIAAPTSSVAGFDDGGGFPAYVFGTKDGFAWLYQFVVG
ncbi:MAG TPA: hypothetical protein VFD92_26410 [Candidatus Binatia bacterium]|nr:hypothetical protein [Candidatus Binatia bacterium]